MSILSSLRTACVGSLVLFVPMSAYAEPVSVSAKLGTPAVLAGRSNRAYLKIALAGTRPVGEEPQDRAAVNVALVIDRSGSMAGQKIEEAKRAAIEALDRLSTKDIVAVVAYDSTVRTIVPATRLTDRATMRRAIERIAVGDNTALFAGVSKGAQEVRKFMSTDRVNRIILLSDGLANVGPSSPGELAELGRSLGSEGISVTTFGLGLGYNEDLMAQLAMASDGNHAFIEEEQELAAIFDAEFGDVLSVVGQDIEIQIRCPDSVKIKRALGRPAAVTAHNARTRLNQVYAGQEKYVLLELQLSAIQQEGVHEKVADVSVSYKGVGTRTRKVFNQPVFVDATKSFEMVKQRTHRDVEEAATELLANEQSKVALALRDRGEIEQAERVLQANALELEKRATEFNSAKLRRLGTENLKDARSVRDEASWGRTRKVMRKSQHQLDNQQAY